MGRRKLMVDPDESALLGSRYRCENCRKEFYIPWRCTGWAWAMDGRKCCSYGCMRALERIREELEQTKKLDSKVFRMYEDWARGMTGMELAAKYGGNANSISTRLNLLEATHPKICHRIRQETGGRRRANDTAGGSGGAGAAGGRPRKERDGEP